jgi:hypothetical protein
MTVTIGRRELLVALGGAAAPLAARAAPPARPVTIGVIAPSIPAAEGLRQGFMSWATSRGGTCAWNIAGSLAYTIDTPR